MFSRKNKESFNEQLPLGQIEKKKFYKNKWFWIVLVILLAIGSTSEPEKTTKESEVDQEQTTETVESMTIQLNADDYGEYGKDIILNEGTEFEDKRIAYYVPVGRYEVTNDGNYRTQVNVYGDNIQKNEDGWEEFETVQVALIEPGGTAHIVVNNENQFIYITSPSKITLVQE